MFVPVVPLAWKIRGVCAGVCNMASEEKRLKIEKYEHQTKPRIAILSKSGMSRSYCQVSHEMLNFLSL